jgi:hypothetical protein
MSRRFMSVRKDMPHERLQEFVVIDYSKEIVILAMLDDPSQTEIIGVGQYGIQQDRHSAEVAFVVKDAFHNMGVGTELLSYLTVLARSRAFSALPPRCSWKTPPWCTCSRTRGSTSRSGRTPTWWK